MYIKMQQKANITISLQSGKLVPVHINVRFKCDIRDAKLKIGTVLPKVSKYNIW